MNSSFQLDIDLAEIRTIRHKIHEHPELGYAEYQTADLIANELTKVGIHVTRGIGHTGLVGTLSCGSGSKAIGLRADMDALPITETNEFSHCSKVPGKMHACGHDGHVAMLLGAAKQLAKRLDFNGTVQFIFQPAEEGGAGGRAMIEDGLFERFPVDAVFGVHNWPGIPAGHIALRAGAMMASSVWFKITIQGVACHAAMPQRGRDALLAAAHLVTSLQSILSRNMEPIDSAVLSITKFNAGTADSIVPSEAWLSGTVRTFSEDTTNMIEQRMRELAEHTASGFQCSANVEFVRNYPPTINDTEQALFAGNVATQVVGPAAVTRDFSPTMASEDFSFMLQAKPGCYAFIGNGSGEHRGSGHNLGPCELHNDAYDFNDAILPTGIAYFVELTRQFLRP